MEITPLESSISQARETVWIVDQRQQIGGYRAVDRLLFGNPASTPSASGCSSG